MRIYINFSLYILKCFLFSPTREAYRYRPTSYSCSCCSSASRALREVYKEEIRCSSFHSLVSFALNVSHCASICSSGSDSSSSSRSRSLLTCSSISRFCMCVSICFCTARGLFTLPWLALLIAFGRCCCSLPCGLRLFVLLASDLCTWPDVDDPFADLSPIPLYDMSGTACVGCRKVMCWVEVEILPTIIPPL